MKHFVGVVIFLIFSARAKASDFELCTSSEQNSQWNLLSDECPTWEEECLPTVMTLADFNVSKAANEIQNSLNTKNLMSLIKIISNINQYQRQNLRSIYKEMFDEDLFETIKRKLNRSQFRNLIRGLMRPLGEFYAFELQKLMNTKPIQIIETLASLSNKGIKAVAQEYNKRYTYFENHSLVDDMGVITFATLGDYRFLPLLTTLASGNRTEGIQTVETEIRKQVVKLAKADSKEDYAEIVKIFLRFGVVHLRKVFDEFQSSMRMDVEEAFINRSKDLMKEILITLYKIIKNRSEFFAESLHASLNKRSCPLSVVDHRTVRRILVGRSGIDLGTIKKAYERKYNVTLATTIQKMTSGAYLEALLKLIGEPSLKYTTLALNTYPLSDSDISPNQTFSEKDSK